MGIKTFCNVQLILKLDLYRILNRVEALVLGKCFKSMSSHENKKFSNS